ncbi:MAG: ABC transporter substrate-binding protein, partial [Actinobacteria bacterium]|nr:ABC transporter substrate-binding protein [Actinomycetota bacterium]
MQRVFRRESHRGTAFLLALVVGLLGALSVSTVVLADDDASPAAGEKIILRAGWTNDPDNLNPFIGYESSSYEIWRLNYSLLTGWNAETLEPQPDLAESWEVSDDGKIWTFKIRQDATWHDGTPVTAKDVAWTYNTIIQEELSAFTLYTEFIEEVETPDDYTAVFVCSQPKANMLGLWIPILPGHIWGKVPAKALAETFENEPPLIGSGPFQVVEWKKGEYVQMKAYKDYFGGAPTLDEVIFQTYQNSDTMAQDMKAGALDAAWNIPEAQVKPLNALDDVTAHGYTPIGMDELGFNCYEGAASLGHPVLRDAAFRRALNYAVDKEQIKKIAYSGYGIPGLSIIQPDKYTDPDWHWQPPEPYEFDLEKAKTELDAAGYGDTDGDGIREYEGEPIVLRLYARSESASSQKAGKLITGWFEQIGLKIKYEVIDDGVLADKQFNSNDNDEFAPDFDMFIWGWGGDIDPNFILSIFTTDQIESWSDCNWSNAEYDELFKEQQRTIDPQARKQIIDRMQEIWYEESPYIILQYPDNFEAYNTGKWTGWVRSPAENGAVWYTATAFDSYMNLKPNTEAAGDAGGSNTGLIVGIIVA